MEGDGGDLEGVVVQGEEVLREVMGLRLDITDIDENEGSVWYLFGVDLEGRAVKGRSIFFSSVATGLLQ